MTHVVGDTGHTTDHNTIEATQASHTSTLASHSSSIAALPATYPSFSITQINVKDPAYGAVGDGTTDDTAAIQAALNAAVTSNLGACVFFPRGNYKITAGLSIPFGPGLTIRGESRERSIITQATNSTPIFYADQSDTHSVHIADLQMTWANAQTSAHTGSYAVQWRKGTGSTSFYWWTITRCLINRPYTAIGQRTGDAAFTVWGLKVTDCQIVNCANSGLDLGIGGGKPSIQLDHVYISNTGTGLVPLGPAINVVACDLLLNDVDLEGWSGKVIVGSGTTTPMVINSLHLENGASGGAIELVVNADGGIIASGVSVSGYTATGGSGILYVFHVGAGFLRIDGITTNIVTSGTDLYIARVEGTNAHAQIDGVYNAGSALLNILYGDSTSRPAARSVNGYRGSGYSTTANRPVIATNFLVAGTQWFDTTLGKPIWVNAALSGWVDATGAAV